MYKASGVRKCDCSADTHEMLKSPAQGSQIGSIWRPMPGVTDILKGFAGQKSHCVGNGPSDRIADQPEHGRNAGVFQSSGDVRLPLEPPHGRFHRESIGADKLDSDLATEFVVVGDKHLSEAACGKKSDQPIPTSRREWWK